MTCLESFHGGGGGGGIDKRLVNTRARLVPQLNARVAINILPDKMKNKQTREAQTASIYLIKHPSIKAKGYLKSKHTKKRRDELMRVGEIFNAQIPLRFTS